MTGQEAILKMMEYSNEQADLARCGKMLQALGNPQESLRFVHVGGTNGKGSVSAMLYSVLNRCEFSAGLFSYPYLYSMHQGILAEGVPIEDDDLGIFGEKVLLVSKALEGEGLGAPSELELAFATALLYFQHCNTEIVVVEAMDGGAEDITTLLSVPLVTVLCHMEDEASVETLEQQMAMVKSGTELVLYHQSTSVMGCVEDFCGRLGVTVARSQPEIVKKVAQTPSGQTYSVDGRIHKMSLTGEHQLHNVALVVRVMEVLKDHGFGYSPKDVYAGISRTVWPGRFERVHMKPDVILDCCDNVQSLGVAIKTLQELYPEKKVVFLGGVLEQQDYGEMISLMLPLATHFVAVSLEHEKALSAAALAEHIEGHCPVIVAESGAVALEKALALAAEEHVVCTFGSFQLVGEIRHFFGLC